MCLSFENDTRGSASALLNVFLYNLYEYNNIIIIIIIIIILVQKVLKFDEIVYWVVWLEQIAKNSLYFV